MQLTLVSNVYSFKLATMTTSMGGVTSSRIKIMVYYAQMANFVRVGHLSDSSRSQAVSSVLTALRMQVPIRGQLCALKHLTAVGKVCLEAGLSVGVGVAMVSVYCIVETSRGAARCFKRHCDRRKGQGQWRPIRAAPATSFSEASRGRVRSQSSERECLLPSRHQGSKDNASDPVASADSSDAAAGGGAGASTRDSDALSSLGAVSTGVAECSPRVRSRRTQLCVAVINYGLTMHGLFVQASLTLLHCVTVPIFHSQNNNNNNNNLSTPSRARRLFVAGSVDCELGPWRDVLICVACGLCTVPMVLPLMISWSQRQPEGGPSSASGPAGRQQPSHCSCCTAGVCNSSCRGLRCCSRALVRTSVAQVLLAPYHPQWFWWEAVLMGQRVLLGLVFTFVPASAPATQSLVLTLLCVGFLVAHTTASPFVDPQSQTLQTVLLYCLIAVSLSSMPGAISVEAVCSGGINKTTPVYSTSQVLQLWVGVVIPLCALTVSYTHKLVCHRCRWMPCSRRKKDTSAATKHSVLAHRPGHRPEGV